jgi:hypothetical protein
LHGVWIVLALGILVGLVIALRRRAQPAAFAVFFGGVWSLLTVTPLTGVVYHSPRHLYFPTIGLALALGLACAHTRRSRIVGGLLVGWFLAGHIAALGPWRTAATASRDALATLDRELANSEPGVIAVSSVPATLGPAWMWAWSSPQAFGPPFITHAPAKILEHPINYSRGGPWYETRRPLDTLRAATGVVVLYVDLGGRVSCRRLSATELAASRESLARTIARGISPESWNEWVREIALP